MLISMYQRTWCLPAIAFLCVFCGAAFATVANPGDLTAYGEDETPLGACPLERTDVEVSVSGFIARVTLVQRFKNPFEDPIEAVYTFPLSDRAAVDRMTMRVGDRTIKGMIKEREEARRLYEAAREAGKATSLLDQERPNIFTQSVANILPGEGIEITISYVEYLKYEAGEYEFSFPMVVGPRYIPGQRQEKGTDQVPDAARISPPVTPEGTRAGHDIGLTCTIEAGLPLQGLSAELHDVEIERPGDTKAVVRLKDQNEIPNRDFVLKYAVAGAEIEDTVLQYDDERGGFFSMVLYPPARVLPGEATPKEMIFVIDCSGSMRGFPLDKARRTMRQCIEGMNPRDTFNLISFAGGTGYCFPEPVPNSPKNRREALDYLDALEGRGGTEMMGAIRAALGGQHEEGHLRVVCFMTDGFIGNDMAILDEVKKTAATARVFSFGIGNGVNRFLIEEMARMGRGAAEVVTLESDGDAAATRFKERIQSPVLTDITIDFGDLEVEQVYPAPEALPDLFASTPVVLTGRYRKPGNGAVTLRGRTASGAFERAIPVAFAPGQKTHDVLAPLWARARVEDLMAQDWIGLQSGNPIKNVKSQITQTGLEFGITTQFTSFVAVEEKVVNEGGKLRTVEVPVEMTDGVSYEGVFGDQTRNAMAGAQVSALGYVGAAPMASGSVLGRKMMRSKAAPEQSLPASPPPPVEREALPQSEAKPQPAREDNVAKLHPALQELKAKLVNGSYKGEGFEVVDGWFEVTFSLTGTGEKELAALKALGVEIKSVTHAGKRVMARIYIDDLEKAAALDIVVKIYPPGAAS